MKVSMFHLMPHRDLPADFEQRYHSVWVDPPWGELADAEQVGQYYNWTLDELTHAANAGLDGVCVNEHHQNAYGFMPGPNLMGSALARATSGQDVAIVQMGATLPTTIPPIRVAEEYGMLDCISGGRLVAGMPLGSSMDANLCYGIPPIEHRDRYYEAHDLIMKAWQAKEMFAWNGRYYQLPMVNLWPRPIQQPHPPVWVPGSGSLSTWNFSVQNQSLLLLPELLGQQPGQEVMDGFWNSLMARGWKQTLSRRIPATGGRGRDRRPGREGLLRAHPLLLRQVPAHRPRILLRPGISGLPSLDNTYRRGYADQIASVTQEMKEWNYQDFIDNQLVIGGSPASVVDQLEDAIKKLRVGNLMVLLHIGSMPH